jgi:hypothetical protein
VRTRRLAALCALLLLSALPARGADTLLVLKDGRRIPVTRLVRREGMVLFETTRGERFSVPEDQVLEPPLDSIPSAAPPRPAAPATPVQRQTVVLKDGRRIPVLRVARRGGMVLLQTEKGEAFSVPEDQVVEPPLDAIPRLDAAPVVPPTEPPVEPVPPAAPPAPAPPPPFTIDYLPVPSRWNVAFPDDPRIVKGRALDPYNQNVLKGDKPVAGDDVFMVLTGVLDVPLELRRQPVGSGVSTADPSQLEFFGRGGQLFTTPRALVSAELFKGQTAFRPKTWSVKATGVFNVNYLRTQENNQVDIDVREGKTRRRQDFSLEEAYAELKLLDLSPQFDFLSVRAGIQPFVSDFRGLVFSDTNLGVRLFGSLGANRYQYNLAYFDLLEKETNSELNTFEKREQRVMVANFYMQDAFTPGYTVNLSLLRSEDHASHEQHYDANGFLVRPAKVGDVRLHDVNVNYFGLSGDGHWGGINVTHSVYAAFGSDKHNPIVGRKQEVMAGLLALEFSVDRSWARFRAASLMAHGDDEVGGTDKRASGFDVIYDLSNFAGGPFSFWSRSGIALTQTGVLLKPPGSLLPTLRSNKFEGQANYVNPGIIVANLSLDLNVTPKLRAILNGNYLWFENTDSLETVLFQDSIDTAIGLDLGAGVIYRPFLNENVVLTAGATGLLPSTGFDDLYRSFCTVPGCGAERKRLFNAFAQLKLTF